MRGAIAALPMYDFPALREAHDAFWRALADELERAGLDEVPEQLTRGLPPPDTWRHPRLLLGQACEYPLAKSYGRFVRLVATPRYRAPGCEQGRYRSAIIVRTDDPARRLEELRGRRCAVNEPDSNSGMNLLRAAVAPLAGGRPFFAAVHMSGAHLASVAMVASQEADVAAIDAVSLAHIAGFDPALAAQVRVLAWTEATPCLPYVTAASTDAATARTLRETLARACARAALEPVLDRLLIEGFDCDPDPGFGAVLELERRAAALDYPALR